MSLWAYCPISSDSYFSWQIPARNPLIFCIKCSAVWQGYLFRNGTFTQQNIVSNHFLVSSPSTSASLSATYYFFFIIGPARLDIIPPSKGPANAPMEKKPVNLQGRLQPILHMPLLIDCFLIIQNHYLQK